MKRAFPNQVNSAPASEADTPATPGTAKLVPGEGNRRTRISAATLGLAISMGASSLLLPSQGDSALAADPDAARPQTALAPSVSDQAIVPQVDTKESSADLDQDHTVFGQAPWQADHIQPTEVEAGIEDHDVIVFPKQQAAQSEADEIVISDEKDPAFSSSFFKHPVQSEATLRPISSDTLAAPTNSLSVKRIISPKIVPSPEPELGQSAEVSEELPTAEIAVPSTVTSEQPLRMQSEKAFSLSQFTNSPNSDASETFHQVAEGETVYSIARQYGISEDELESLNQLSDPTLLKVGQSIVLPSDVKRITPAVVSVFGTQVASQPTTVKASEPQVAILETTQTASLAEQPMFAQPVNPQAVLPQAELKSQMAKEVPTHPASAISLAVHTENEDSTQGLASQVKTPSQLSHNTYVEELRAEVSQLRTKSGLKPEIVSANIAESPANPETDSKTASHPQDLAESVRHINPEFNPEQYAAALREAGLKPWSESHTQVDAAFPGETESLVSDSSVVTTAPTKTPPTDREVSAAPIGASNYAPIRPPQLVSPELPALESPQSYLPKPSRYHQEIAGYIWPSQGVLTSGYGWRWGRMHKGIDIAADIGTPVVAAAPGVVTYAAWNDGGYGNLVEITHSDGSVTVYAHNDRILVNEGQQVEQGEQISEMGSTGFSTGPHLHFEVHPPGQGAVDPIAYLPQE